MEQKTPYGKNTFVFITIAFCLGVATFMGFDQSLTTKVAEIVADGLISLALFVAVSFLASYSLDYSGVLGKIGSRVSARAMAPEAVQYQSVEPTQAMIPGTHYSEDDAKG